MLTQLKLRNKELEHKHKQLQHIAYHDPLTELPNIRLFKKVVTKMMSKRNKEKLAILFIDLDDFKGINDNYGHDVGDQLLITIAKKLSGLIRNTDWITLNSFSNEIVPVARMGGDEFTIMLSGIYHPIDVAGVIERIFKDLEKPLTIKNTEIYVQMSIGISIYPDDSNDINDLMKFADIAMYQAKETGKSKNNFDYFNHTLHEQLQRKVYIEHEMPKSLSNKHFKLFYQPQYDLHTGTIVGMEALVRWEHPDDGLIMPDEFIPVAEKSHFIVPLGEWILKTACQQLHYWQKLGISQLKIAINISPIQFNNSFFITQLERVLSKHNLLPRDVELELTENILMEDHDFSLDMLYKLNNLGVLLSIDDFGTGYSSFRYLSRFNADLIKIDKSFLNDIETNKDNQTIVKSIISLAHNMGIKVIAEGVENTAQIDFLLKNKCDIAQGYYYSKPLPASKANALIQSLVNQRSNLDFKNLNN